MKISTKIILIYILGGILLLFTTIFAYKTFDELDKYSNFISQDLTPLNSNANNVRKNSDVIYNLIERESLGGKKASREILQTALEQIAKDSEFLNQNFPRIAHIERSTEIKKNIDSVYSEVKSFTISSNLIIDTLEQSTGVGSQADVEFDELYDNIVEKIRLLGEEKEYQSPKLQKEIGDARYLLAHGHLLTAEILSGDEGEDFKEVTTSFSNGLLRITNLPKQTAETNQIVKDILQLKKLAQERYDTMLKLREKKDGALKVFETSYQNFTQSIEELSTLLKEEVQEQNNLFTDSKSAAQRTMFSISIAAVVVVLIVIMYLFRNIFVPFEALTKAIENIKNSELNEVTPGLERSDELGVMAKVLEDLKDIEAENLSLNNVINAHSLISITDIRGKIISVNDLFCEISKYTREELIGKDHRVLNSGTHNKDFFKKLWETIKSGGVWQGEICNKAKDGSLYWVDATITAYTNAQGQIEKFVAVRSDITEKKAQEKNIIEAMENANEANKAKSQFLANMSHEIRTPLNSIIGYSDILSEEDLPDDIKNMMKSVKSNSNTLLELVNDILDLAKIESGELELDITPVNLNDILFETTKSQVSKIADKDLQINIDTAEISPFVLSDQLRLKQVLINLLGNSIKFTEQGEVFIKAALVSKTDSSQKIHFSIKDSGIGMSQSQIKNIFKAFRQADGSTTRKYGGTGLGLNITKKILEKMDSKIIVQSELGKGTEFSFTIEFENGETEQKPIPDLSSLKNKTVLILDKNIHTQTILEEYIGQKAKQIFKAESYEKAQPIIHKEKVDLLIVDQLSFRNSTNLCLSDISNKYSKMNLLGLTSTVSTDSIGNFKESNFHNYLIKPIQKQELSEAINSFYESSKKVEVKEDEEELVQSARILVVDDNPSNLKLADKIFSKMGHSVVVADSGKTAIKKVADENFNIIFMDMQMPGLSGPETTEILRDKGLETPIIALTANAFDTDRELCMKSGMNDFTTKPLKRNELSSIIQKYTD